MHLTPATTSTPLTTSYLTQDIGGWYAVHAHRIIHHTLTNSYYMVQRWLRRLAVLVPHHSVCDTCRCSKRVARCSSPPPQLHRWALLLQAACLSYKRAGAHRLFRPTRTLIAEHC